MKIDLLGYIWAGPCSIIGLIVMLISKGNLIYRSRFSRFYEMERNILPLDFIAITFGNVVLVKKLNISKEVMGIVKAHEEEHSKQFMYLGIFFYIFYALNFSFNLLRYRNFSQAYRNIWLEKKAFIAQEQNIRF